MNRYYIASFQGVYLGGYAVIVAPDLVAARASLDAKLAEKGYKPSPDAELTEVKRVPGCTIIWDGDY